MASFRTHIEVAALGSGMLSSVCLGSDLITPIEALALWMAGTLGGILPDLDSDNSTSLKIIFNIISLGLIGLIVIFMHLRFTTLVIWGSCIVVYCLINVVARPVFESATIHRGIFHTVITGLLFSMTAINLSFYYGKQTAFFSWMIGLFVLFGFFIHLILDEISSVDIANNKIKRSFGTAFKLYEYKNLILSTVIILITLLCYNLAPSPNRFYQTITDIDTYHSIKASFLPEVLMK
ncbi:MAG: metal-dependent hydrolase [Candidatus Thiodiazotropha sp.]